MSVNGQNTRTENIIHEAVIFVNALPWVVPMVADDDPSATIDQAAAQALLDECTQYQLHLHLLSPEPHSFRSLLPFVRVRLDQMVDVLKQRMLKPLEKIEGYDRLLQHLKVTENTPSLLDNILREVKIYAPETYDFVTNNLELFKMKIGFVEVLPSSVARVARASDGDGGDGSLAGVVIVTTPTDGDEALSHLTGHYSPTSANAKPHCPLCDALIAKYRVSLHLEGFNSKKGMGEVFASHIHNFLDRHSDTRVDDLSWEAEANLKHLLVACDKLVQRSESGDVEEPASKHVTMVVKWTEDEDNENRFDVVEFIDKFVVDPNKSLYKDIIFGELNTSSREAAQHHLDAISSRRPAAATQAAATAATAASTHGSDNNSEMISYDQMTFQSGFSKQHRP